MLQLNRRAALRMMGISLAFATQANGQTLPKEHKEFHALDLNNGWRAVAGYPDGVDEKILSGHLDEAAKRGSLTRLLRFKPGVFTTASAAHTFWEEVYVLSGDFIVGNNKEGKGGERFLPNTYACRPPGITHGPFKSETGCLLLEIRFFDRL
jgi:hypothetical protein